MDVYRIDDSDDGSDIPGEAAPESDDESEEPGTGRLGDLVGEHPLAALGGALALGYLVGGGLGSPLGRRALRAGVRLGFQLAVLPELEEEVAGLATRLGQTLRTVAEASERSAPARQRADKDVPKDS
jgi:hypothetical protein